MADPNTKDVHGSTYENRDNLPVRYFDFVINKYKGTRLGKQEIYGEILEDNPDALWTRAIIEKGRRNKHPDLVRVVVAVDPEAKNNTMSAETGIIVGGVCADGEGWILSDGTVKGSPDFWGNAVISQYHLFGADKIVAEINQGGEMVEFVIHTIDKNVPYKGVHACRGKYTRAEPVSALYEQGRIHHVGSFPELEDQLCEWVPGGKSPDRLDSLVWLVTELMLEEVKVPGFFVHS